MQTLRRVPRGVSVKNYVCISCQTYTPPFLHYSGVAESGAGLHALWPQRVWPTPNHGRSLFGLAFRSLDDVAMVSVSRSLALFLGLAGQTPSKRRRSPLQPFTNSRLSRSTSKLCTVFYGALRASCEVDLRLSACSSANPSFATGDSGRQFDHSLSTEFFFLVFTLFLVSASN